MKQWVYILVVLSCFMSACISTKTEVCSENKAQISTSEEISSPSEMAADRKAEFSKRIKEAVEKAQQQGATKVDIYLDEDPDIVQINDVVTLRYQAVLDTGATLSSSSQTQIVAGRPESVPGIGTAVLGMGFEKKKVRIKPGEAFGEWQKDREKHLPRVQAIPVHVEISTSAFKEKFNKNPETGERIRLNPYFESEVTEITNDKIQINNLAMDGYRDKASFGETMITVKDGTIFLQLTPVIGAEFPLGKQKGRISSYGGNTFIVDLNHPLAGHALDLNIEVTSIVKASDAAKRQIPWITDYDTGMEQAMAQEKDMVLVLYASWCPWCKKLLTQTFEDPRIRLLNDKFVFVKANSEENTDLKEVYEQDGFPLTVLTDPGGRVIRKFEGFKNAPQLLSELEALLKSNSRS